MVVTTTWHNAGPDTIWAKLAEKLGREPTQAEAAAEVKRILAGTPDIRTVRVGDTITYGNQYGQTFTARVVQLHTNGAGKRFLMTQRAGWSGTPCYAFDEFADGTVTLQSVERGVA